MADQNPTGRGAAAALKLPADHVRFLRGTFSDAREGVRDEMGHPEGPKDPDGLRSEAAAYGRLLTALDDLVIVPDEVVCEVVSRLVRIIDESNEYERVVTEHDALNGLLAQLR